ncbi:molybdopterin-binding domain-containing protein [Belnapia moabensis]|uniref:hypothetical protein n=1 Tax=Belnapia moabensis TaxID=365533 RepID=UPI0006941F20|nr:hypothetical protein [Belnapia moabensis]
MSDAPRLAPVAEARALLPGAPVAARAMPLGQAIGHVLAASVRAAVAVPKVAVALREGWAVEAATTEGAGPYAPVPLPGLAWVAPGEALPAGTDAVLPAFARDGELVLEAVAPGEGVRPAGEDAAAGAVLREAGHLLGPLDLMLGAAGVDEVPVRVPRVVLRGVPGLAALLRAEGAVVVEDGADLAIALAGEAEQVLCPAIALRPGDGVAVGLVGGVPALLLPPDPAAMLAGWWLLGRPAVRAMAGRARPAPGRVALARKVASPLGFTEAVMLGADGAQVGALGAAAWVLTVPAGREGYEAGAEVEVEAA